MKNRIYGFGIVDKAGNPYWDEVCVCEDREPLDDICADLNSCNGSAEHDHRIPYRVVRLYFQMATKRNKL
jgi:hypothetical protein